MSPVEPCIFLQHVAAPMIQTASLPHGHLKRVASAAHGFIDKLTKSQINDMLRMFRHLLWTVVT